MQLISQNHQDMLTVFSLYHRLPRQPINCNKTSPWTLLKLLSKPQHTIIFLFLPPKAQLMGAKPPYPIESTTVTGSNTVLPIHL